MTANDSIAKTVKNLTARGVPLFRDAKRDPDGNNQCCIKDHDDNRGKFMQMLPGNMQEAAIKRLNV